MTIILTRIASASGVIPLAGISSRCWALRRTSRSWKAAAVGLDQSSRVQAVCDLAGPTDFPLWGGKAHPAVGKLLGGPVMDQRERAADASAVTHITKDLPPFLIIHGEKDTTVPIEQARALHDALKKMGADVTLKVLPNVGHNLILPETDKMAVDFFDKHLKAAK